MEEPEFEALFYSSNAVLSSFAARTKIARAIGMFGPQVNNMLDSIRRVRNVFAHTTKPITFEHELISQECTKLPAATLQQLFWEPPKGINPNRERYISVCMNLVIILEDHAKRHAGQPIVIDIPDGTGISPPTSLKKTRIAPSSAAS